MLKKKCTLCGEKKPKVEFYRDRHKKDGLCARCKCCEKAYRNKRHKKVKTIKRAPPNKKKCVDCLKVKRKSEFYKYHARVDGLTQRCRKCRYQRNRNRVLMKTMGVSLIEAKQEVKKRKGRCDLCSKKFENLVLDHHHGFNRLRGVLCNSCNVALGMLGDDVEGLQRAVDYLKNARDKILEEVDL